MSFSEPRGRRVDAAEERHTVSVSETERKRERERRGGGDRLQLLAGLHQTEVKRSVFIVWLCLWHRVGDVTAAQ